MTVTASTISFLCILGTGTVKVTDNVGHAGLVADHGGEVDGLLGGHPWGSCVSGKR